MEIVDTTYLWWFGGLFIMFFRFTHITPFQGNLAITALGYHGIKWYIAIVQWDNYLTNCQQQYVDTALWVSKFKPLLGMQLWCAGFWGSLNKKTQLPQTHFGQVAECYININWIPTIVASCWNSSSGGSSLATWFLFNLLLWGFICSLLKAWACTCWETPYIQHMNVCTNLSNLPPVFGVPARENPVPKSNPCCYRK